MCQSRLDFNYNEWNSWESYITALLQTLTQPAIWLDSLHTGDFSAFKKTIKPISKKLWVESSLR